jgi:hypothetical protein
MLSCDSFKAESFALTASSVKAIVKNLNPIETINFELDVIRSERREGEREGERESGRSRKRERVGE